MDHGETLTAAFANQVEDFENGEEDADEAGDHHEEGKDSFLGGPGDEAVHFVGTGLLLALDERGEVIALVDVVEEEHKRGVHSYFEDQSEDVGPPQAAALLAGVLVETAAVFTVLQLVFPFLVLPVGNVHHNQEGRAGDKDELQCPQPHVRDREEVVVADVVAAGLNRVALKVFLFITPHLLCRHHKHHDPKEENNGEPNSAEGCGVFVHPAEEALEECPVHDEVRSQSVFSSC